MELIIAAGRVQANFIIMHEEGGVPAPAGDPNLIKTSQNFHLHFDWTQSGALFNLAFPGTWDLRILFEQMGAGEGPGDIFTSVPYAINDGTGGSPDSKRYHNHLRFTPPPPIPPGVYRLVAQLSLTSGGTVLATGFEDLGIKQFYVG